MLVLSNTSFSPLSLKDMPYYSTYTPTPLLAESDSFASSARQAAFRETAAQRRARVEFLQKREGERRVENWVRAQIQNSAFMVTVSEVVSAAQQSSAAAQPLKLTLPSRGHRRDRHQSLGRPRAFSSFAFTSPQVKLSDSDSAALNGLSYDPRQGLTPISEDSEEEEPYILYSTPKPPAAPLRVIQPQPQYSSAYTSSTPYSLPKSSLKKSPRHGSPRRHRRHSSDLESIPEVTEE